MSFDYIVIGAGSAGSAVAARLSEGGTASVLLLEAGPADTKREIHVPAMFPQLFKSEVDWAYETEPQAALNGRRVFNPRGKMLGGCSSINAMIYQRGNPKDYDHWASLGNQGWSYADLLPLFKRSENFEPGAAQRRRPARSQSAVPRIHTGMPTSRTAVERRSQRRRPGRVRVLSRHAEGRSTTQHCRCLPQASYEP